MYERRAQWYLDALRLASMVPQYLRIAEPNPVLFTFVRHRASLVTEHHVKSAMIILAAIA